MRAAVTPAAKTPIELRELPDPEPADGEVLVRIHAASVNRLDRAVWLGVAMGGIDAFPLVQGVDAAGVVEIGRKRGDLNCQEDCPGEQRREEYG